MKTEGTRDHLLRDLSRVLNFHGEDNRCNTPDFQLAERVVAFLDRAALSPSTPTDEALRWEKERTAELLELLRVHGDGAWIWETDGDNDLDSLTGPILITAEALRGLLSRTCAHHWLPPVPGGEQTEVCERCGASRSTEEREPEVPQEHMLDAIAEYTVHAPNCPFYEDGNCECAVEAFRETLRRVLVPSRLAAPSQEGEVVAFVAPHHLLTEQQATDAYLDQCEEYRHDPVARPVPFVRVRLTPTQEPTDG
ncbi:MAG: hypothetical protein AMXMBFR53_30220 [Gemmatimonadota bacterium]